MEMTMEMMEMTPVKALHHINEEIEYLDRRIASSAVDEYRLIREARRSSLLKERKAYIRIIKSDMIRYER